MVFMAILLSVVLSIGFGEGLTWLTVLMGAFLLAVIMMVMPAFAHPWMKRVTGNDVIAIGHFGTLGYIAAGAAGSVVGKHSPSSEDIKFPQEQNAVLIGFISSFVGGLVMLLILDVWLGPAFGLAITLPGMVPHFFTGGGAGVFGNATGGRRGAVAGGFVNGLLSLSCLLSCTP